MAATRQTTRRSIRSEVEAQYSGGVADTRTLGRVHRAAVRRVELLLPQLTVANLLDIETFLQGMVDHQFCTQRGMPARQVPFVPRRSSR